MWTALGYTWQVSYLGLPWATSTLITATPHRIWLLYISLRGEQQASTRIEWEKMQFRQNSQIWNDQNNFLRALLSSNSKKIIIHKFYWNVMLKLTKVSLSMQQPASSMFCILSVIWLLYCFYRLYSILKFIDIGATINVSLLIMGKTYI